MTAVLEVESLTRNFGGLRAVDEVTFSLRRGTVLGLIGPNGAGKSTVVNLVTGHLAPTRGRVRVGGRDVTGAPPWKLVRAGVARTFQVVRPFEDLTVLDNVAVSAMYAAGFPARAARTTARRLLEQVGLATRAGDPAGQLGVADSRRLELARALATHPRVLVLDEILGGLAQREIAAGVDLLAALREQGIAILLVEHHMGAVRALCDRVIMLERGRPLTSGPPAEVLSDRRVVRAYLGARHPGTAP